MENHGVKRSFPCLFDLIGRVADGEEMGHGTAPDTFISSLLSMALSAHPTTDLHCLQRKMNTSSYIFILP